MPRAAVASVVLALVLSASGAAHAGEAPEEAPLATVGTSGGPSFLARLDPVTLAERQPRVDLPEYHHAWSFSPDGSSLALGKSAGGPARGIGALVVDATRVEVTTGIQTPIAVEGLAWLAPRRLVVLLQGNGYQVNDPVTGERFDIGAAGPSCSTHPPTGQTGRALVILGRRRLVTVDATGGRRVARLGRRRPDDCDGAALVTAGNRAFVVAADSRLTEVDLASMRITDHRLSAPRPGEGYTRAVWVGEGRIAAAHQSNRGLPGGAEVIDTRRNRRLTLERRAGAVTSGAGLVLVYNGARGAGIGLSAYRPDGRVRFRALRGQRIDNVQVAGRFAYAIGARRLWIVDLPSGRVVSRAAAPPSNQIEFLAPAA